MIEELIDRVQARTPKILFLRNWSEDDAARRVHQFQLARLRTERLGAALSGRTRRLRVLATACWSFPVYSQTFVYQELSQLVHAGFDLRFLYSKLDSRDGLPSQFSSVWSAKRKLVLAPAVCERDYDYFRRLMPEKVDGLVETLCRFSGMSERELRNHRHFLQGFAFARMVEAYRPDYLHSYFFYEGTLFALFASFLLDIPRGVSCYADHMLNDYDLKLVPLHLEQCSLVVATSARIKRELTAIAPRADAERIIVKPNAINTDRFPVIRGEETGVQQSYRLTCVSRIEPKKGILYLVEAVRRLLDAGLKVELHLLGGVDESASSREYAQAVNRRIGELNLASAVHLEGRKSEAEIKRFFEKSDLFVAPFVETEAGDKDGIPTALLEAMSCGLPAVATDAGSIPEVIDDGRDGVLVPQRDPAALADAIQALLLDPQRRRNLGSEAARKIRDRFDVRHCEKLFHDRIRSVTRARAREFSLSQP